MPEEENKPQKYSFLRKLGLSAGAASLLVAACTWFLSQFWESYIDLCQDVRNMNTEIAVLKKSLSDDESEWKVLYDHNAKLQELEVKLQVQEQIIKRFSEEFSSKEINIVLHEPGAGMAPSIHPPKISKPDVKLPTKPPEFDIEDIRAKLKNLEEKKGYERFRQEVQQQRIMEQKK